MSVNCPPKNPEDYIYNSSNYLYCCKRSGNQGPIGPQGDTGPTGLPGTASGTGAIGPTGPAGGPTGSDGPTGSAGPTGPAGSSFNSGSFVGSTNSSGFVTITHSLGYTPSVIVAMNGDTIAMTRNLVFGVYSKNASNFVLKVGLSDQATLAYANSPLMRINWIAK